MPKGHLPPCVSHGKGKGAASPVAPASLKFLIGNLIIELLIGDSIIKPLIDDSIMKLLIGESIIELLIGDSIFINCCEVTQLLNF